MWHEQGSGPARVHALDALVVSLTDVERAWLRALCGFLNTGEGGRVYMGVLDSGVVVGLEMTSSLLQHLQQGTHDMMSRYSPPVSRERYTVREPSYCTHSAGWAVCGILVWLVLSLQLGVVPVIAGSCSVEEGLQQHREVVARCAQLHPRV